MDNENIYILKNQIYICYINSEVCHDHLILNQVIDYVYL